MTAPTDVISLADLQSQFAAALRTSGAEANAAVTAFAACVVDDGLPRASRVQVYRNNGRAMYDSALARTYPVLKAHVGEARFAALAAEYRESYPSRSGDLHWVGAAFPAWLEPRVAGTVDEWLADLARLEWSCEESLVSELRPAASADALARVRPEDMADLTLALQPALRLVESRCAAWSVWRAAQASAGDDTTMPSSDSDVPQTAVQPAAAPEYVAVTTTEEGLVLHSLPADRFRFVGRIAAGRTIEQATDESGLLVEDLPEALAWLFGSGLVISVHGPDEAKSPERTP
jgi:hypothetical protein